MRYALALLACLTLTLGACSGPSTPPEAPADSVCGRYPRIVLQPGEVDVISSATARAIAAHNLVNDRDCPRPEGGAGG